MSIWELQDEIAKVKQRMSVSVGQDVIDLSIALIDLQSTLIKALLARDTLEKAA